VGDLTCVVQALIPHAPAIRLWIVTANCQPVCTPEPINVSQATLWGFAHTLFLERSEMRGGLIDLDLADDPNLQATQVLARIAGHDESMAAFRAGACYAPRLTPAKLPSGERLDLKRDGVYLITGGLGGLGLKCAEWMAQRGAGEIVLLSRSGVAVDAEDSKVKTIQAIERAGTKVTIIAADVSDHARMSEIIGELTSGERQVRGVIHAAGVNWFSKVADLDRERMLETLKTKVSAAWHLHKLTEPFELDFFILFSSVSAVWGSVDLAHYTAANQFLGALAYERRRQGQHALTIDWGPWSEVGMSAKTNETHLLTMLGFRLLPSQQALATMEALLISDKTRAVVADIDWEKFRIFIEFSSYPKLFDTVRSKNSNGHAIARGSEADRIKSLPPVEARARLVELLQQQFASILLLEPGREVDVDQRFNLMGMDSLMSITFALRLENLLHVTLPSALVYNYPTIREAADYLFEVIRSEKVSDLSEKPFLSKSNTRLWFPYLNGAHGASVRLFCFPYAGSGASIYRHWQELLRPAIEVVPVQLPGREDRIVEPALREMRELASSFVNALRELPPAAFALFGHSMGALICFAVMCELRRLEMHMPTRLFVSACVAPNHEQAGVHNLPEGEFQQTLVKKFAMPKEAVANERWWNSIQQTLRCDINLLESYKLDDAVPLNVPVTVLGGADDPVTSRQALLDWSAFTTTDFSLRLFPGDHMYIKQHESQVIEILKRELS
jgi:surfactin synthase thioesterase subunit/short-subunit dehydrogenase/acyl carrier protein